MIRFSLLRYIFSAALLGIVLPVSAQFNGPAIQTGGQINQPTPITVDKTLLQPNPRDIRLIQGDQISIKLFEQEDYSPSVRIGVDGNVLLPLIGIVSLNHLTITEAENLIRAKLIEAGMYTDPQVTITVTDGPGAQVTIIGEMHGVLPIIGSRGLLDVLSTAGGLPGTASHVITINRPGVPKPIVVDLGTDPATSSLANIPIFPGDTIVVSRIGVVYLLGSFGHVGAIPLQSNTPLTLLEVVSLGGGPTFVAKYSNLRLIRTVGDHRTVVKLDLKKVMFGKDPDPILQTNDILFLPDSFIKSAVANGTLGTALGLVSFSLSTLAYIKSQ